MIFPVSVQTFSLVPQRLQILSTIPFNCLTGKIAERSKRHGTDRSMWEGPGTKYTQHLL